MGFFVFLIVRVDEEQIVLVAHAVLDYIEVSQGYEERKIHIPVGLCSSRSQSSLWPSLNLYWYLLSGSTSISEVKMAPPRSSSCIVISRGSHSGLEKEPAMKTGGCTPALRYLTVTGTIGAGFRGRLRRGAKDRSVGKDGKMDTADCRKAWKLMEARLRAGDW